MARQLCVHSFPQSLTQIYINITFQYGACSFAVLKLHVLSFASLFHTLHVPLLVHTSDHSTLKHEGVPCYTVTTQI